MPVRSCLSLYLPFLLKTFSINPFQGQYPNIAVRIITTPTNPRTHRKTPEMKKAKIIKITPMTDRKIASPLPTFFIFATGSMFPSLFQVPLIKNSIPFSEMGFNSMLAHILPLR